MLLVPKGEDFCITARLRRVCVLDDPPVEPNFMRRSTSTAHLGRVLTYVDRTYPVGTPLDDLDVDIRQGGSGALAANLRPIIETWVIGGRPTHRGRLARHRAGAGRSARQATYKTFIELWLETLRDEYERDCARSPLEPASLSGETRSLDTCFTFASATRLA